MSEQSPQFVDFHVQQSTDFKTNLATGCYASLTPNGLINLSFYIDRLPIPDLVTYTVENNKLGPEKSSSIRKGFIRELQQGIILDVQTAKNLLSGLQQIIRMQEESTKAMNS